MKLSKKLEDNFFSLSLKIPIEISIYDRGVHEYLIEDLPVDNIDYISRFLRDYEIKIYMFQFDDHVMHIKFIVNLGKKKDKQRAKTQVPK